MVNQPVRHHYLPEFYLKRWQGSDNFVCRFTRPYKGMVKPKRVAPTSAGFQNHLYSVHGKPLEEAVAMERDFMSSLDTRAANALAVIENGVPDGGLRQRTEGRGHNSF